MQICGNFEEFALKSALFMGCCHRMTPVLSQVSPQIQEMLVPRNPPGTLSEAQDFSILSGASSTQVRCPSESRKGRVGGWEEESLRRGLA